ncbi:MAG: hypothetical protein HW403_809 [Dehalococcoidia bacterium]|nr:hypothetical protein [Dehalococcoidia bacterium]
MANRSLLGVFRDPDTTADAIDALKGDGFAPEQYDVLTGTPYPEGAFGERHDKHRVYVWPLVGAACGFSIGLLLTWGTQVSYPMVTGGKPLVSIPPMVIIMYEGTMLGAILFTVLGVIFESRLPKPFGLGLYDTRITAGYIGLHVSCPEERLPVAERALRGAGAEDVKLEQYGGART